ncbi:MAG: CoA transferase [Rhodospirillaceae bacterium]|jgi:crotonobetainyl-CoA:carnitine CoA-transferase CaiB-like acyl-CoA transferase|nr:CoA transferase [Rhodospirillaceae bacterium]MBT3491271.1 CoA transferase [Rhodospirillaceae bacterium]MBT3782729.1 CoA transferase [Rhodospirillaceae bacterium]MBT3979574.1 CoA transferase [Rhodospirillaceae bacterium]MBT4168078.1 CoA transferase [Rhodospirillaceae bacterium]
METLEILQDICRQIGLPLEGLNDLTLMGREPVLPSSFRVGTAAQASIAASALAAAQVWYQRSGKRQAISVDMRHASIEFRSERYLKIDGGPAPALWDKIAGTYETGDGRWVRLHTNFPHHRDGVLEILGCANDPEAVAAALRQWRGQDFEDAAAENGLVATMMRSPEEWQTHPQAQALDQQPLISVERIGDAPPRPLPPGARPLDGIRVLDLTRIIAGPVCGRTLAAHGADVMRVTAPHLPSIAALVTDAGRGKLSSHIDLRQEAGRESLRQLIAEADILVQGYRPGGLERWGFGTEEVAKMRPGIIYVSLSAYGHQGPWSMRRGFDSLVQTASGINFAEVEAAGANGPKPLPCQALDHASGYFMAAAAMATLARRADEGGSWHIRVALARTGRWLQSLGRVANGFDVAEPDEADVDEFLEERPSGYGMLTAVRHAAHLSETPAHWARPSMPLGSHPPVWP